MAGSVKKGILIGNLGADPGGGFGPVPRQGAAGGGRSA